MPSKTSSYKVGKLFHNTLFKKNLLRFWPLWLCYTITWVIMLPLTAFFAHRPEYYESPNDIFYIIRMQYEVTNYGGLTMAIIFGVLVAMAMFSYLMNARSVGLMHTLPIRREGLFLTNYVSGLFMFLCTHVVTFLLLLLVMMPKLGDMSGAYLAATTQGFWVVTGLTFFFYSFGVFCAVFTGQVLAVPAFYAILNVLAVAVKALMQVFVSIFLYGIESYSNWDSGLARWLSPVFRLSESLDTVSDYNLDSELIGVHTKSPEEVGIYAIVGVVLIVVAYFAYKYRRSESAGDVVAIGWAKPVFKYGVAFCSALSLGQGLYALTWGQMFERHTSLITILLCMIATGWFGYYAAEMLLKKSFRVFKSGFKGAAIFAVALLLLFGCMATDVFGVEKWVPDDVSKIEAVDYHISGHGSVAGVMEDEEMIANLTALHQAVLANRDEQEQRYNADWDDWENDNFYVYFHLNYYLENDREVSRNYHLVFTPEELSGKVPSDLLDQLKKFTQTPSVQLEEIYGSIDLDAVNVCGGEFYYYAQEDYEDRQFYSIRPEEAAVLQNALIEDATAGRFTPVFSNLDSDVFINDLNLEWETKDGEYYDNNHYSFTTNCTSTIAALKELGIVNDERLLVTEDEMYAYENSTQNTVSLQETEPITPSVSETE